MSLSAVRLLRAGHDETAGGGASGAFEAQKVHPLGVVRLGERDRGLGGEQRDRLACQVEDAQGPRRRGRRGQGLSMSSTNTSCASLSMLSISLRTCLATASQFSQDAPVIGTPASISSSTAAGFSGEDARSTTRIWAASRRVCTT